MKTIIFTFILLLNIGCVHRQFVDNYEMDESEWAYYREKLAELNELKDVVNEAEKYK